MKRHVIEGFNLGKIIIALVMIGAMVIVYACGGGSGGKKGNTQASITGTFWDSEVDGLSYTANPSGLTGTTQNGGKFECEAGDSVTFSLGDVFLGETSCKAIVTLLDLVPGAEDETDPVVTNIARLLQSLDSDFDPSNGITIDSATVTEVTGRPIDITNPEFDFDSDTDIQALFTVLAITPVSAADAQTHFMDTLSVLFGCEYSVEWTSLNLQDSCVASLAIDPSDPSTIYAGTVNGSFPDVTCDSNGVYISTDGGGTWIPKDNGLPVNSITYMLALDPSNPTTLYVGTHTKTGEGVFKSNNGGESWSSINSGLTDKEIHSEPVIDPISSTTLYVGTEDGVFKSTNGGTSWFLTTGDLGYIEINPKTIDPSNPSIIYVADHYDKWCIGGDDTCCEEGSCEWGISEGGLFKSTDGGGSWFSINNGLPDVLSPESSIQSVVVDPTDNQIVYAGSDGGGIFKSTDGGGSWSSVNSGLTNLYVYGLIMDPENHNVLYAGTWDGGVFMSRNGGERWSPVNSGLTNLITIPALIHPSDSTIIYAGTLGSGVFKGNVIRSCE